MTNPAKFDPLPSKLPDQLLTRKDLALKLKVSLRTVDNYIKNEEIPIIRYKGIIRFDFHQVMKVLSPQTPMALN